MQLPEISQPKVQNNNQIENKEAIIKFGSFCWIIGNFFSK